MRELCRFKTVFTMSALTLIVACSAPAAETEDDNDGGEAASGGQDAQGGADQGGGGNGGMGGGPDLPQGWTSSAHPCVGNRTDSMLFEADNTVWTGCGSTTIGYGLYMSTDAGMTFSAPETTPAGWFDTYRVLDVSRSSDGLLYVAGTATTNSSMVVSVDTSVSPMVVTEVLNAGPTIDESFIAGTFRRRADGSAIAESLNGNGMLYRPSDSVGPDAFSDGWENAYYWANGGSASFQLLDMEIHDEAFYGCGSTIADTPPSMVAGHRRRHAKAILAQRVRGQRLQHGRRRARYLRWRDVGHGRGARRQRDRRRREPEPRRRHGLLW